MKIVSLFAGCGGLDLGMIKAGHKIVYASDFDEDCKLTYEKNFGKNFHLEDVHNLDGKSLPNFDILMGGFPCQGFSVANLYRSEKDERNSLYLEMVRIINETLPPLFLAENVPGILSLGHGKVVDRIMEDFGSIGYDEKDTNNTGYEVHRYLLNAADYGVPQGRKRVIFLGMNKKLFTAEERNRLFDNFPPKPTFSKNGECGLKKYRTLRETIGDLPEPETDEGKSIPNHYGTKHKVKINGYIGNRKLDWDDIGPTIVGRGGGSGGPVIAVHPNCQRRFTVRETARIQTFPDSFIFCGSISSQYRQIGNAVAVQFAYYFGKSLRDFEKNNK